MNKKGVAAGILAVAAIAIVASYLSYDESDPIEERTHGDVSTTMGSPILGTPSASVTIVEFGDYQCHQCYNWFHNTKPAITRDYIEPGKANLVFVDFAFLGRDSGTAAQASYCAEDQGKYWPYHDVLYESQEPQIDNGWAGKERLKAFAFSLDMDMEMFEDCLDSGKYKNRVQYNTSEARKQGVNGTPTFVIVGPSGQQETIVGAQPLSVFKQVIDSMI